jgi:hypothetical protein
MRRFLARACLMATVWLWPADPVGAQEAADTVLYRIFLTNGTSLVSYGEYAEVDSRVVFSLSLGEMTGSPRLQLVSLPDTVVDRDRTEKYARVVRASHYAATRGEADFSAMSQGVAEALNAIGRAADPADRLAMALAARRRLAEWPQDHFGYREPEVREVLGLIDEIVSDLRASAGEQQFELKLIAHPQERPRERLLPAPTLRESIEQALLAARLTEAPAERMALLQAAMHVVDGGAHSLSPAWVAATRASIARAVGEEVRVERAYAGLVRRALGRATSRAARADVRGVESILRTIPEQDQRLGEKRPQEIAALQRALEAQLDAARRLRLARDHRAIRGPAYRAYRRAIGQPMQQLDRAAPVLADIKLLAGPRSKVLRDAESRLLQSAKLVTTVTPPAEFETAHALLANAAQLAERAVRTRREAVLSGDLQAAWDASSAAAGALMLLARARAEINQLMKYPTPQ